MKLIDINEQKDKIFKIIDNMEARIDDLLKNVESEFKQQRQNFKNYLGRFLKKKRHSNTNLSDWYEGIEQKYKQMDFTFLNEQLEEIYQLPLPDSEMEEYSTNKTNQNNTK